MAERTVKTTWGGYCFFPDHPLSDMHGIVRFCVRVKSSLDVREKLDAYGAELQTGRIGKLWGESVSHVEQEVTARDYGEVYFCRPALAYTQPDCYQKNLSLLLRMRQETKRLAKIEGSQVRASGPNKRRVEFP